MQQSTSSHPGVECTTKQSPSPGHGGGSPAYALTEATSANDAMKIGYARRRADGWRWLTVPPPVGASQSEADRRAMLHAPDAMTTVWQRQSPRSVRTR